MPVGPAANTVPEHALSRFEPAVGPIRESQSSNLGSPLAP